MSDKSVDPRRRLTRIQSLIAFYEQFDEAAIAAAAAAAHSSAEEQLPAHKKKLLPIRLNRSISSPNLPSSISSSFDFSQEVSQSPSSFCDQRPEFSSPTLLQEGVEKEYLPAKPHLAENEKQNCTRLSIWHGESGEDWEIDKVQFGREEEEVEEITEKEEITATQTSSDEDKILKIDFKPRPKRGIKVRIF